MWKDLFEEGFGHSLQVAAIEYQKLREPKVAKLKGGYSSDASLVFQFWLKDIWVYVLEHHLSQQETIQSVKDYTSKHAWLKVEYYLGLTPKNKQSFQGLKNHLSLPFQSCETVSSMIGDFLTSLKSPGRQRTHVPMSYRCWLEILWLRNQIFGGGESSIETLFHTQYERPLLQSGGQGTMFGFPWLWEFHSILGSLGNDVRQLR